ncbi:MAG: hypothetical protein MK319_08385 [Pseudomonadales bacterium]|nr:hypothetical protein [Pseudomonadales bacterium]
MNLTRVDALRIAEENGIQFRAFEAIEGSAGAVNAWVIIFFSVGTFLSASGFVIYSYIKSKNKD